MGGGRTRHGENSEVLFTIGMGIGSASRLRGRGGGCKDGAFSVAVAVTVVGCPMSVAPAAWPFASVVTRTLARNVRPCGSLQSRFA
jgi:hypothetical protein